MFNLCDNELIKFTIIAFKVVKMSLPEYSCEKSKHTYTQHQLMVLLCLMKRLRFDYRLFISIIQLMPEIQLILGLKTIPHYTALQKFFKRTPSQTIGEIIDQSTKLFTIEDPWIVLDGTGHSSDQASLYYTDNYLLLKIYG